MCSSSATTSSLFFVFANTNSIFVRRNAFAFASPVPSSNCCNPNFQSVGFTTPKFRLAVSLTDGEFDRSWFSASRISSDNDYGGWAVVDYSSYKAQRGMSLFKIGGICTSIAVVIAAIAFFSLSRKGFRLHFNRPLHGMMGWTHDTHGDLSEAVDNDVARNDTTVSEASPEFRHGAATTDKPERVVIRIPVDSAQEEALSALIKLKIIDDDKKADELCTRREYARWLVRINTTLERNPRRRIVPSVLPYGSTITAFDDISFEDPDFWSIQALAEAGIVPSKLSQKNSGYDDPKGLENVYFFPERYISRQNLIDWKAQLEYHFVPGILEKASELLKPDLSTVQISSTKVNLMDMKEINAASPELCLDILAGEKSILRRVFGQSQRFQPKKPSTKAQAAVALVCGRMADAINSELSSLKAESSSRKVEIQNLKSEVLDRGYIQRHWDERLNEEKKHGFEVQKIYLAVVSDLEQEKILQDKNVSETLKEKAATECQRQLLFCLKEEVNEMSKNLASERSIYVDEQSKLQRMLSDLETQKEGSCDVRSALEAEKEAIRILRSWVEDEAKKSQARAKVLEEVHQRWKWKSQN